MLLFILGAMCGTMLGVAIMCCMIASKGADTKAIKNHHLIANGRRI